MPHQIGIDARKLGDFGIGTYVRELVRGLAALDRDNRYLLLVGAAYRGEFDGLPDNFETIAEPAPGYSLREQLGLSWRLARRRLDLYHATHYVLPLRTPRRVVVTIHDIIHVLFPEFLPNRLAGAYARHMIRRSLGRSAAVITDSRSTADDLVRHFGADPDRIQAIYPGVDDRFFERADPAALRRRLDRLGVPESYLLFVGNPKPHKNLERILEAWALTVERGGVDADLVCVGGRDGADATARRHAERLGVADRVRWLGYVEDEALPALYRGATLLLHPTLYEGFGLPVVEAMASGVAVVTSGVAALGEIAAGHAELVDPTDPKSIAAGIARCLHDPGHRRSLAERGLQRARDFSWRRTAEQTLEVYRRALAGDGANPAASRAGSRS